MSNHRTNESFSTKHPVWAVVIIELLLLLAVFAAGTYATLKELSSNSPVLISFIPIALVLIIYFTLRQKWGTLGFRSLGSIPRANWVYYAPLVVILVTICFKGFRPVSLSEILFYLGFTLLVAFVEESLYRGLILHTLLGKGSKTAVITSSLLFSVTHILNALSGKSAADTMLQIVYALLIGAVLALLMVKNRNIIPLILFHFLHNLIQFVGNDNTSTYLAVDVVILVFLATQVVWLSLSFKKPRIYAPLSHVS